MPVNSDKTEKRLGVQAIQKRLQMRRISRITMLAIVRGVNLTPGMIYIY